MFDRKLVRQWDANNIFDSMRSVKDHEDWCRMLSQPCQTYFSLARALDERMFHAHHKGNGLPPQ